MNLILQGNFMGILLCVRIETGRAEIMLWHLINGVVGLRVVRVLRLEVAQRCRLPDQLHIVVD